MSYVRWSDIRDQHVDAIGSENVVRGKARLLARVRAYQLADMRKRRGLTQRQVAEAMGVTIGRVSQIENDELAGRAAAAGLACPPLGSSRQTLSTCSPITSRLCRRPGSSARG